MEKVTRYHWAFLFCLFWMLGPSASAQDWAKEMFKETSHDFGTLARGAKATFSFTVENIYLEDVQIKTVRTSCGCASINYPTKPIKTYETKEITVTVDTRSFLGRKDATLNVVFDKPFSAEVPLNIHSYIRSDVVFQPGAVQFGSVRQGKVVQRQTKISYAGRNDWAIESIKCPGDYLETQLAEIQRGYVDGAFRVTYDLTTTLKSDAPSGYLTGQLILRTNDTDPKKAQVPLAVEGVVESELTVRPASITFLAVCNGPSVKRNVVLQAARPFRVTEITCPDSRFQIALPQQSSKLHLIPVEFTPGNTAGKFNTKLDIKTDLDSPCDRSVHIYAEVVASPDES